MSRGSRRFPVLPQSVATDALAITDADLVARWVADRDESSFELLFRRHSPMVLDAVSENLRCERLSPSQPTGT